MASQPQTEMNSQNKPKVSFSALDLNKGNDTTSQKTLERYRPFIDYETFVWIVYGTFTVLAILDRFIWNVWPRQTYTIGSGSAGSDFTDGIKSGPWAVKAYDIIARVSGRFSIVALNLLMFTMSHTTFSFLAESWLARNVFDMRNYMEANRRLHKWNGIGIVVMTLLHVWSVIFPCIFHGWHAQVVLGKFEWILSERGPKGFKDINTETKTMSLQGDDVFRIVEMTILLAILLPLSIRWLSTRWHLGVQLHSLINILYFIDIVRRHTHPHSWILNTPFFFWWIADLTFGLFWRRENPEIFRKHLSQNYMLLFWRQDHTAETVGPKYYLKLKESSLLERAHVFTGFENRSNLDILDGHLWSSCLVVRVYHTKRTPRLGRKDAYSHTKRVAESTELDIWTWGPYVGDMSEKLRVSLESGSQPVTLISGGSAAGYIIDAIQKYKPGSERHPLTCLYTTRDTGLFQWVLDVIGKLLQTVVNENVTVVVALTDGGEGDESLAEMVERKQKEINDLPINYSSDEDGWKSSLVVQYGRLNFHKQVPQRSIVYFQGSGGLHKAVEKGCKAMKCRFIAGPAYDQDKKKNAGLLKTLRLNCLNKRDGLV